MNKLIIYLFFLLIASCGREKDNSYLTSEKASEYFKSIEDICNLDNGRLWGKNLYGPILLIDRKSRKITSNQPDNEGLLKGKDGIYTGLFPKELIILNAPVNFGGTLFAMVPLPDEEDSYRIKSWAIRGLFHCFQQTSGIPHSFFNSANMDEKEARLWIKLEWKALRKALNSEGKERQLAIRDALIFRGSNRELYLKYTTDQNRFETYEGLSTFTYTLLCTNSCDEFKSRLFENMDRIYSMQSYARSYGFIHGALYASLLHQIGFDFRVIHSDNYDLGNTVKELYQIELPEICRDVAGSLAVNYEIDEINREEELRLANIKESLHKEVSIFTERPVVFLELESPYFDFEPENIHSLDTLGTLYSSMRISDNWGKLTVDKGGCLVSNSLKYLRITAKGIKTDKSQIAGEGWILNLNSGWELVRIEDNYFVRMLMP
jgi:hypothetical protein